MHASWEQRFETWWRHTPITPMNLSSRRIAGTIADVYTSVRVGDTCLAMKTVSSDSKKIMHDNIMLFSEYHIHRMIQEIYDKEERPSRLVRVHWIRKIELRGNVVVAFAWRISSDAVEAGSFDGAASLEHGVGFFSPRPTSQ